MTVTALIKLTETVLQEVAAMFTMWKLQLPTLPEWQKYHRLHCEEFHLGIISTKKFFGGNVEQEESIQSKSNADVVDDCYVQVAMTSAAHRHTHNGSLYLSLKSKIKTSVWNQFTLIQMAKN